MEANGDDATQGWVLRVDCFQIFMCGPSPPPRCQWLCGNLGLTASGVTMHRTVCTKAGHS
ncbi:hypothetical protein CJO79_19510 (plasmid) [Ralstonia solanacearum]|nr:hypothetical protein CJO76_19525 [Ralstonia solanacearum]AXV93179.1 hypothetical protein CJO79_19510 [Ralstonia solanacearum]AXW21228.1 hypothetical protein CJO85_19580 [Ralstonia solanacearum]AXW78074.1 hypothetical protein CJO97_19505 [Ralstonia solanacearum]